MQLLSPYAIAVRLLLSKGHRTISIHSYLSLVDPNAVVMAEAASFDWSSVIG